jgi:hypothetical protein
MADAVITRHCCLIFDDYLTIRTNFCVIDDLLKTLLGRFRNSVGLILSVAKRSRDNARHHMLIGL